MLFPAAIIAFIATYVAVTDAFVVENEAVSFSFHPSTGAIVSIVDKLSGVDVIGSAASVVQMINYKFVGANGILRIGETGLVSSEAPRASNGRNRLSLSWSNVGLYDTYNSTHLVATVDLGLEVELDDSRSNTVASFVPTFKLTEILDPVAQIGVWDVTLSVPTSIASDSNGQLFYPAGYGYTYPNPLISTGGAHAKTYPGGEATMQFMALGNSKAASGLYMGAADRTGSGKLLQFSSAYGKMKSTHGKAVWRKEELDSVRALNWSERKSAESAASVTSSSLASSALSIVINVPNSGVPAKVGELWSAPYGIMIGAVPQVDASIGRPLWAQAASIYKSWSLQHADWTSKGPLNSPQRKSSFPDWYLNTDVWLNTHWQCHDIFNRTGGEPSFVAANTGPVADKIRGQLSREASPIALHWYEWQQGPSPNEEDRYLFDTHYPDYFPSRTNFKTAVKQLREEGNIYTFPYINGRISDINSNAYLSENGAQYCTKLAPTKIVDPENPIGLTAYVETYGSNATFCVTNPFTPYWQGKLADTCKQLVGDYDVAGVYIDQIGSATQKFCWDASHQHSLGGGDYWVKGYDDMMKLVNSKVAAVSQHNLARPMVTEDNAEPYMSMVQGLLSLNAFKAWYMSNNADVADENAKPQASYLRIGDGNTNRVQQQSRDSSQSHPHVSPAYPFVYGGYFVGFGAIWARADFDDHSYWAAKLSTMLITGAQLGWFSIAGRSDDPEDGCGPMGVGDLFLSAEHADTVAFLQTAIETRSSYRDYFNFGQLSFPPSVTPSPRTLSYVSSFDGSSSQYSSLLWQAWTLRKQDQDENRVAVIFASTTESVYDGQFIVDSQLWFPSSHVDQHTQFVVTKKQFPSTQQTAMQETIAVLSSSKSVLQVPISVPAKGTLVVEVAIKKQ